VAFTVDGTGLADVAVARAGLTVPVPAGLDLATATTIPLTWATAFGLVRVSHAGTGDTVLVTAASGGVGSAIGQLLARQGVARVIGRGAYPGPGRHARSRLHPAPARPRSRRPVTRRPPT